MLLQKEALIRLKFGLKDLVYVSVMTNRIISESRILFGLFGVPTVVEF